jgi:molybdopterin/thiamine biosynthesis adenylyltransferase
MEYFKESEEFTISIPEHLNQQLKKHLIRRDYEEDLCFALYNPSNGKKRTSALLQRIILPNKDDRQRHGNVSFNPKYFKRVCQIAIKENCGIMFLHSHPGPGWQDMSSDDIKAEKNMAPTADVLTNLPLVGLTVGHDGTWSGRVWQEINSKYRMKWASVVKGVGSKLDAYFADTLIPKPISKAEFIRTLNVWGQKNHDVLARLRFGIVGLGSVGSNIAHMLSRMGMQKFVLIDFDEVQRHNLDRLQGATVFDIGQLKIDVANREIRKTATAANLDIVCVPYSIAEKDGYEASLDCDIIFSCVDRPRPRNILNHIAYNHLIPVVDGGIKVRFIEGEFEGVDWQLQTVGPSRPCLKCLEAYIPSEVQLEIDGKLDDPTYIDQLPDDHHLKRNENIFPFSANLASLEIFQAIALVTGMGGVTDFGVQRFRYNQGFISIYDNKKCNNGCDFPASISYGDKYLKLYDSDVAATNARIRQGIRIISND